MLDVPLARAMNITSWSCILQSVTLTSTLGAAADMILMGRLRDSTQACHHACHYRMLSRQQACNHGKKQCH